MSITMKRSIALASTALSVAVTMPAFAQQAGVAQSSDIVVTARRVEERLQDVPISMQVFDQQSLTERNISDGEGLVNYTPSLSVNSRYGAENTTFALRGFVQETGTAPSVGVYFADVVAPRGFGQGIPAGDGAGPGSFFDLQNVQVLKGPQGTLFGRNTTGGAVLLVPQKPTYDLEGYVEASIGNYDMRRIQAVLNVPLADMARLRIGGEHMKRDGFVDNISDIGPRSFNNTDYYALRASLVLDLSDSLENYTIASYANSKNNGSLAAIHSCYPGVVDLVPPASAAFIGVIMSQACDTLEAQKENGFYSVYNDSVENPRVKLKQWQVINTTTWQATDNLTVKNIFSYARLKNVMDTALYGTHFYYPSAFTGGDPYPYAFVNVYTASAGYLDGTPTKGYLADQSTLTEELQFQGTLLDGALTWQAGGYLERSRPQSYVGTNPVINVTCTDHVALECTDFTSFFSSDFIGSGAVTSNVAKNYFDSTAVYAQTSYELTEQLKVTGGIRYTWDKMWAKGDLRRWRFQLTSFAPLSWTPVESCLLPEDPSQPANVYPACDVSLSKKSNAPTWVIGLDYKPSQDILLYAKYSRGYRTGGVKTDVPPPYDTFDKEKVDSYEVGAKTSFRGAVSGTFNVAGFYNDFSNQQIQYGMQPNPCPYTEVDSLGDPICGPRSAVAPTAGPINVGKSRIWGIEADAQVQLFERLVLTGSYAYLNTKLKTLRDVSLPTDSQYVLSGALQVGDRVPFTPQHKLSLGARYTLPVDESVGNISVAINYSYTSNQIASYGARRDVLIDYFGRDLGKLQSRNIVDLYLNWSEVGGGPIDLGLFVTNLTKEKYYNSFSSYLDQVGFATASYGQPRFFGVRARVNFGK